MYEIEKGQFFEVLRTYISEKLSLQQVKQPLVEMRILFALISIVWWIAAWGFSDSLLQRFNKNTKTFVYGAIMLLILAAAGTHPELVNYL
jgi:hypothetical protein